MAPLFCRPRAALRRHRHGRPVRHLRPDHEEPARRPAVLPLEMAGVLLVEFRDASYAHPLLRGDPHCDAHILQAMPADELFPWWQGQALRGAVAKPLLPFPHTDRYVQRLLDARQRAQHQRALIQLPAPWRRGYRVLAPAAVPEPLEVHSLDRCRLPGRRQPHDERRAGFALLARGPEPQLGRLRALQAAPRPHDRAACEARGAPRGDGLQMLAPPARRSLRVPGRRHLQRSAVARKAGRIMH
mmetsp:Transcript_14115/g.38676  ORF Transcript_14115/g.38676 Transcript_14115/m.38676 type:complete len:243 (-) Transcript_14115:930-1658(-)